MNEACANTTWFFLNQSFVFTVITKSVRKLCALPHCLFLKINNARIPDERGARLHQIGPTGLRSGGPALLIGYRNPSVNAIRRQNRCSFHEPNGTHKYNVLAESRILKY